MAACEGALFDGIGFVAALRHAGFEPRGRRALLVGAGGAGVAIATALADAGVSMLSLFDAVPTRAAEVPARLAMHYPVELQPAGRAPTRPAMTWSSTARRSA